MSGKGNPVRDGCCKHAHTGSRETKTKQPTQGTRRPRQIGHTIGMPATIQNRAEAACENLKGPRAGLLENVGCCNAHQDLGKPSNKATKTGK